MNERPFCKCFNNIKNINDYRKKPGYEGKYLAALVNETYFQNNYKGSSTYSGYELNFCPTCGKPLKEFS